MTSEESAIKELFNKINQLDKQTRILMIKHKGLTQCFDNVCHTLHTIIRLREENDTDPNKHDNDDWKQCNNSTCQANYECMIKMGFNS